MYLRTQDARLPIRPDMIPQPTWGISAAKRLPLPLWDRLRREVKAAAAYQCTSCGAAGPRLEADEVWAFDEERRIQTLVELRALCPDCHAIKHWGRTELTADAGYRDLLERSCCHLNAWTKADFRDHLTTAAADWKRRSQLDGWTVDLRGLDPLLPEHDLPLLIDPQAPLGDLARAALRLAAAAGADSVANRWLQRPAPDGQASDQPVEAGPSAEALLRAAAQQTYPRLTLPELGAIGPGYKAWWAFICAHDRAAYAPVLAALQATSA